VPSPAQTFPAISIQILRSLYSASSVPISSPLNLLEPYSNTKQNPTPHNSNNNVPIPQPPAPPPPKIPTTLPSPSLIPISNDSTTLIRLQGFVSGHLAFRRYASEIPTFVSICAATYEAFGNLPEDFRLHFHYRQDGACSDRELLERDAWDRGECFIGGEVDLFAHFTKRDGSGGGGEMGLMVRKAGERRRGISPTPPENRTMGGSENTTMAVGGEMVEQSGAQQHRGSPSTARIGNSMPPPPRCLTNPGRINPNSTTVYSMAPLMSRTRYPNTNYYSAPSTFIPDPAAKPRIVTPFQRQAFTTKY
jgi:hypothetical protein